MEGEERGEPPGGAVEELVENTTVIAVNVADDSMLRPGDPTDPVSRSNSNRSADGTQVMLKGKKLGHRRVKDGEVTYKKFETTPLMRSIQLGIHQSVGNLASQEDRDILHEDFYKVETVVFSRDGSLQKTPAHSFSQFKFRTYAPVAFRKFRNIFSIERDKFLVSLCAEPMIELSNPGASGSIFYVTQDDEIICKTVSHKESRFLQEILPAYYLNLHQNFRTLLPKFFGFYCYSCNTKNVRIIVMKNLLPKGLTMHHKFDLKGSTYKRKASRKERAKANPTFKDLDFMGMYPEGVLLQPELYNSLMDTIERDCRALESLKIMDYSFLMGIHNVDHPNVPLLSQMKNRYIPDGEPIKKKEEEDEESDDSDLGNYGDRQKKPAMLERIGSFQQRERLIAHSTALESITAEVDDVTMADMIDENDTAHIVSTYGGIPAKNHKGENLLIFIGIIDILQSFGVAKKLEHTWKSLIHDGDTVSVHRPSFYAARFKKFLAERVFRKMPPNLKPALSFRRSQAHYKRAASREATEDRDGQRKSTAPGTDSTAGVTVITIGGPGEGGDAQGILPAVLRDKPRLSTATVPPRQPQPQMVSSARPDVADVVAVSCTPPPADVAMLNSPGMSGDERVQIYVPSPQSTPYSTISKHAADSHKSITFLSYQPDSLVSASSSHSYQEESKTEESELTVMTSSTLVETKKQVLTSTSVTETTKHEVESHCEQIQQEGDPPISLTEIGLEIAEDMT